MTQTGLTFEYGGIMTQDQEQRNSFFYSQSQKYDLSQRDLNDDDGIVEESPRMDFASMAGPSPATESSQK
eukprot:3993975-Ditylum_brightwellii.AAC.1